ncbi:MAG: formylmethanofuran dehydrogenase subunit E family protein [Dehalococcoidales bacterium]|nr:formylmethanofuran dehydrogenase subunit E family protein [Dehalococcoidales bacterium]
MPITRQHYIILYMKTASMIRGYSVEEYCEIARKFHGGNLAPGMIIAGFMVDLACRDLPENTLFEVICETSSCIPDAVQLLTPCTIGNQWMKIIDVGRYAMTFYDKYTGVGFRIHLDSEKLKKYPTINEWYFKLKDKHDQDKDALIKEIVEAGTDILTIREIAIDPEYLGKKKKTIGICPVCGEGYRSNEGEICPACREKILPYQD